MSRQPTTILSLPTELHLKIIEHLFDTGDSTDLEAFLHSSPVHYQVFCRYGKIMLQKRLATLQESLLKLCEKGIEPGSRVWKQAMVVLLVKEVDEARLWGELEKKWDAVGSWVQ
jgi:hypothetical protein